MNVRGIFALTKECLPLLTEAGSSGDPNSPFAPLRALVVEGRKATGQASGEAGAKRKRRRSKRARRRGPTPDTGQSIA